MLSVLCGENYFELRKELDFRMSQFIARHSDLAVQQFDAEEASVEQMLEAVQSMPFLVSKKMVVIHSISANKEASERINDFITATSEDCELILIERNVDKRSAYFKVLKAQPGFREFTALDQIGLSRWIMEETGRQGGQISSGDANYLVSRIGLNQQRVFNELLKLVNYEPHITRKTIDLLTDPEPQSKIFELLDAAFTNNKKKALALYDEQRAQKVEPQQIIAMLAWQLHLMALVSVAQGRSVPDIARDSGIKPYSLQGAARLSRRLNVQKIHKLIEGLLKIDRDSKRSALDLDEALRYYVITI